MKFSPCTPPLPPFVLRALPALAFALMLTLPGVALADSHTDSNDTEEATPSETDTSDKTDEASDLPEVDGWIEVGASSFDGEVHSATLGTVSIDGTGIQIEAGLRRIGNTGAWISLSHLTIDSDYIEIGGVAYEVDENDDVTFLSAGWEWITGAEKRWRPYVGAFLGTDSNSGLQGGIRYRLSNNVELGGKIIAGGKDNANDPEFSDSTWTALGVTVGYVF